MSSGRRREFVLRTVIFLIVAVGTYTALGKLLAFILTDVVELEIGSEGFRTYVLAASTAVLVLTVAVPVFTTRFVLKKFS